MSKLVCMDHKNRVMVLPKSTIHRKDGQICISEFVEIGGLVHRPEDIRRGSFN